MVTKLKISCGYNNQEQRPAMGMPPNAGPCFVFNDPVHSQKEHSQSI